MGFSIDDTINQWMLGLNGSWEIDLFGRLRRNVQAANSEYCASVWAYRDTMMLVLAEVATNYVDARKLHEMLACHAKACTRPSPANERPASIPSSRS